MDEPLVIVGAGGHARETAYAFLLAAKPGRFLGFLADEGSKSTPEGWPIIGTIDAAASHVRARFIVAINDPRTRRTVVGRLTRIGVDHWGCVIHPDVRLHASVRVGVGTSILGGCQLTTNIHVGHHCILNRGSQVGHDAFVGDFCSLNPGACVAGGAEIGPGCELGSMCALRQRTAIGVGATVGMGATVLEDVPSDAVVVGNPARLLRSNPPW
jgi:sugar O-acyltransferase (sialic acid O-acetyltransferase NeuD family)